MATRNPVTVKHRAWMYKTVVNNGRFTMVNNERFTISTGFLAGFLVAINSRLPIPIGLPGSLLPRLRRE